MGYEFVAIGCSWGGLRALSTILADLPSDLPASIGVVQHRGPNSPRRAMLAALTPVSPLQVMEIEDKDPIEPGRVYLAPPDYHLIVEPGHFALSTEEAVEFARPSVDVFFETAADSYADKLIAVVLTGANEDGAAGLTHVKRHGGLTIVQDPDDAERPEMPRAAVTAGVADKVLPLAEIPGALRDLIPAAVGERDR